MMQLHTERIPRFRRLSQSSVNRLHYVLCKFTTWRTQLQGYITVTRGVFQQFVSGIRTSHSASSVTRHCLQSARCWMVPRLASDRLTIRQTACQSRIGAVT